MTPGEAWLQFHSMTIPQLILIASRQEFGFEEETARSFLRIRLHANRESTVERVDRWEKWMDKHTTSTPLSLKHPWEDAKDLWKPGKYGKGD